MNIDKYIIKQIKSITRKLIDTGFQVDYNWVSSKNGVIRWENFKDISFSLKQLSYRDLYDECIKERAFNLRLLDGALVQLMYECNKNEIIKHRLAYYPNPDVERFQDDPENFEQTHYGNELFSEIYKKRAIVFPIRFDLDLDAKKYIEHNHSFAHLTLGNYKNCRIPVSKPITPNKFIIFILRNFYFDKFISSNYSDNDFDCSRNFQNLTTKKEEQYIHISL